MPKPTDRSFSGYTVDAIELLGSSIRAARIEQKLRMEDIAERAGISRGLLRRIENGDPGVSLGAAFEVATIVGVPLFEVEHNRLASHLAYQAGKLALLPNAARRRRREGVKDDF